MISCRGHYTMDVYYKYYSYLKPEHLINPTIKLSQPAILNDPFERFIPEDAAELLLVQCCDAIQKQQKDVDDDMRLSIKSIFTLTPSNVGIVSLSETHRNLLMWAHYADSHRGICIGYKNDFLSSLTPPDIDDGITSLTPLKVNYDSCRFDSYKFKSQAQIFNDVIMSSLLTKSNDWIYEKEHRCIVPFTWADKVIINGEISHCSFSTFMSDDALKSYHGNIYSLKNEFSSLYNIFSHQANAILLKDIKPESICELYLGSNISESYRQSIFNVIREHRDLLGHIRLYGYQPSKRRFELEQYPISI